MKFSIKSTDILTENLCFTDYVIVTEEISNLELEIERLNNIINELEKYLWEERYNHHGKYVISGGKAEDIYTLILDKIKELKENNNV